MSYFIWTLAERHRYKNLQVLLETTEKIFDLIFHVLVQVCYFAGYKNRRTHKNLHIHLEVKK